VPKKGSRVRVNKTCEGCKQHFEVHPYRKYKAKFCSVPCADKYKMTDESKQKLHKANRGKPKNPNAYVFPEGETHPMWRGDKVEYSGLHSWVSRQLGKPRRCELCGDTEALRHHWANLSGEYHRDLKDWMRMCPTCHSKYDRKHEEAIDQVTYLLTLKQKL